MHSQSIEWSQLRSSLHQYRDDGDYIITDGVGSYAFSL